MKSNLKSKSKIKNKGWIFLFLSFFASFWGCSEPNSPSNATWIFLGLSGETITNIKTTQSYVYVCASYSGLFRHSI